MARAGVAWVVAVAAVAGPVAGSAGPVGDLTELLRAHRIRPIAPPVGAPDFTLPALGGGETTLSESHGRWVLLTFFATWCGPCRVELPTLDQLRVSRGGDGLELLTVSIDRQPQALAPFLSELGVELPVLWDRDGTVGAAYRAASIPVSYLIDPTGSLVGISRGARDWSALAPLFDRLLELAPGADAGPRRYTELATLSLPAVLEPPSAEWSLPGGPPRPGRPFALEVRLHWSGRLDDYLPQPPRLELPEGITAGRVVADSSSRDGLNRVRYRLELTAAEAGSYALDPIELRYLPALEDGPAAVRVAGPTVEVAAAGVTGAGRLAAAAAAVVGLATFFILRRWRRAPAPTAAADPLAELQRSLDRSRAQRLEGNPGAAFESLLAAARGLEHADQRRDLEERLESVRFGGQIPYGGELEAVERRLRRRLEQRRPDPEAERRRRLRLRADGSTPGTREERPA